MHIAQHIVETAQAAFNRRDIETLLSLWTEDFRYEGPDGTFQGRAAMTEREHQLWRAFPDAQVSMRAFCVGDGRLVIETTMRGTHRGPLRLGDGEVPASGRAVCLHISANVELAGGKIRAERVYFDRLLLIEQLGLR